MKKRKNKSSPKVRTGSIKPKAVKFSKREVINRVTR